MNQQSCKSGDLVLTWNAVLLAEIHLVPMDAGYFLDSILAISILAFLAEIPLAVTGRELRKDGLMTVRSECSRMQIEVLYFEDCPNHLPTVERIDAVLGEEGCIADAWLRRTSSPSPRHTHTACAPW
jgi:hypothetical protein